MKSKALNLKVGTEKSLPMARCDGYMGKRPVLNSRQIPTQYDQEVIQHRSHTMWDKEKKKTVIKKIDSDFVA